MKKVPMSPRCPWWIVILTGPLGVAAAMGLTKLYEKVYQPSDKIDEPVRLIVFLLGSTAVAVTVLLTHFSATALPVLPIAIEINDVYGGFVLGLMYKPLVNWLVVLFAPRVKEAILNAPKARPVAAP